MKKALIKEIFTSIQGEGLYVGEKQLFIRFSGCNLKCSYCDTDHSEAGAKEYTIDELYEVIQAYSPETISLTGGEPLLWAGFLEDFLEKYNIKLGKIYLETNGTLYKEFQQIVRFVDIISMDIKLKSACDCKFNFEDVEKFTNTAASSACIRAFLKVVFDKNITDEEIEKCTKLAQKYSLEIVLQPKMPLDETFKIEDVFEKFYAKHKHIRLIPQTHKMLNIR